VSQLREIYFDIEEESDNGEPRGAGKADSDNGDSDTTVGADSGDSESDTGDNSGDNEGFSGSDNGDSHACSSGGSCGVSRVQAPGEVITPQNEDGSALSKK